MVGFALVWGKSISEVLRFALILPGTVDAQMNMKKIKNKTWPCVAQNPPNEEKGQALPYARSACGPLWGEKVASHDHIMMSNPCSGSTAGDCGQNRAWKDKLIVAESDGWCTVFGLHPRGAPLLNSIWSQSHNLPGSGSNAHTSQATSHFFTLFIP